MLIKVEPINAELVRQMYLFGAPEALDAWVLDQVVNHLLSLNGKDGDAFIWLEIVGDICVEYNIDLDLDFIGGGQVDLKYKGVRLGLLIELVYGEIIIRQE